MALIEEILNTRVAITDLYGCSLRLIRSERQDWETWPERAPQTPPCRRGQGAQYERNFLGSHPARHCVPGKPCSVGRGFTFRWQAILVPEAANIVPIYLVFTAFVFILILDGNRWIWRRFICAQYGPNLPTRKPKTR
jgi:hypothetical protein